jgi:outer membrane protein assembly factor BamB
MIRTISLYVIVSLLAGVAAAADWPMFRGPNAAGVSNDENLPVEFGPGKSMLWRTELPPGHSSPSIAGDSIFLTGYDEEKLYVFSLDRATGRVKWRREAPRPRKEVLHKSNSPASPTVASDGQNAYVFFTDFGLISYGPDGNERWRLPLGPFNNPMGQAASPVLTGGTLLQICDQEEGSFFVAIDKDTGVLKWRVERPQFTRGFSTPVLYRPPAGRLQVLVAGSYQLTAYEVETGKEVWWVRGLTWQLKPTPVMDAEHIYVLGWAGEADPGQQEQVPEFSEVLAKWDTDKDGKLSKDEATDDQITKKWPDLDLDRDGFLGERDWKMYQSKRAVVNGVRAFKLGGEGDMTDRNFLWKYERSLPNVPSPLLYEGVLYLLKEGGILTALHSRTGEVLKQSRVTGAPGAYFASPVAGDGKIYTVSEEGKLAVMRAGADWEIIGVNDFNESVHATPAIVDGKIYVRTHAALYCFAKGETSD